MPGGAQSRLAARIESVLAPVFTAMAALAAVAGAGIVALIGASVAMRHFVNAPFRFTEELVGLLMTAAFFLALPLVTLRGDHVRVSILVTALPEWAARLAGLLATAFGVIFCVWFLWLCAPWFEFAFERAIKSEVSRLLLYPWMALLPLSLFLTAIAFAVRGVAGNDADKKAGTGAR